MKGRESLQTIADSHFNVERQESLHNIALLFQRSKTTPVKDKRACKIWCFLISTKEPSDSYDYPELPYPPPLSRPRYVIFSWAVHRNRPYGAPTIFHTEGSVLGVEVVILALILACELPVAEVEEWNTSKDSAAACRARHTPNFPTNIAPN